MQISIVVLIFLLFPDQILRGVLQGCPCPNLWTKARILAFDETCRFLFRKHCSRTKTLSENSIKIMSLLQYIVTLTTSAHDVTFYVIACETEAESN